MSASCEIDYVKNWLKILVEIPVAYMSASCKVGYVKNWLKILVEILVA